MDRFSFSFVSNENFSFVVFLLGIQKVQEWLELIALKTQYLTSCLKIMELLLKWRSIDYILLIYSTSDVDNEEEAIRESVLKLIKQVGLIDKIKIIKLKQDSIEDSNEDSDSDSGENLNEE